MPARHEPGWLPGENPGTQQNHAKARPLPGALKLYFDLAPCLAPARSQAMPPFTKTTLSDSSSGRKASAILPPNPTVFRWGVPSCSLTHESEFPGRWAFSDWRHGCHCHYGLLFSGVEDHRIYLGSNLHLLTGSHRAGGLSTQASAFSLLHL